ncbi:MAG TPA: FAD-dependent oxidoreductase [Polyangiales bacterium]|jgi:phytoene dehydrogenase-like protein
MKRSEETLVIGGGLAGLAAALYLARDGQQVRLLERSRELGGRASTTAVNDLRFNLGPHALYCSGAAARVLRDLSVPFSGGIPGQGAEISDGERFDSLPSDVLTLLRNRYFSFHDKLQLSRLLATLRFVQTDALAGSSYEDWLSGRVDSVRSRSFMHMLARLSTFVDAPSELSAAFAVAQLKSALSGVLYLDHGWQSLIDGLHTRAKAIGVIVETSARAIAIEHAEHVEAVRIDDGRTLHPARVVSAIGPKAIAALLPDDPALAAFRRDATPVLLASLDVALAELPKPDRRNVQALDRPLYYSVHSGLARLAREGASVVHVAKYLDPRTTHDPSAIERELREFLGNVQPGYERALIYERFLPSLVVHNALPRPRMAAGPASRFPLEHPTIENLYFVGDWIGQHGLLADAALGSARELWLTLQSSAAESRAA